MAVEVDTKPEFHPSQAKRLFTVTGVIPKWGVTQDGARFLFAVPGTFTCRSTSFKTGRRPFRNDVQIIVR